MNFIENLEQEVTDQANQMAVEVVLLLIDKWEHDIEMAWMANKASIPELLNHYVRLKISLHHVKRAYDRGWSSTPDDMIYDRINNLSYKIKEARRKYYVTKRRVEGEHESGCSCRGCRCLKGINRSSSLSAGFGTDGARIGQAS